MTDQPKDPSRDPFDLLRTHVRAVALLEQPTVDADELVADITGTIDRADRSRGVQVLPLHGFSGARSPRRRRWLVAGAASAIVAVGGAGVAAYVATRASDPVAGIVCRESADFGSYSVVLPIEGDPIAACANLWKTGDLPDPDRGEAHGDVPELVACEGGRGAVEVLPARNGETCESFGLIATQAPVGANPIIELNTAVRASNEQCLTAEQLLASGAALLQRLGLDDWRLDLQAIEAGCSLLAVDTDERVLIIRPDPLRSPIQEETP